MAEHVFEYQIGDALLTMVDLDDLYTPLPYPRASFRAGSERVTLASGKVRDFGWPQAEWNFPMLDLTQRDYLRTFCEGTSEIVYIRTATDGEDLAYKTFKAVMVWPDEEDIRAELVFDLSIKFIYMIEQVEEISP
jgi:hypothetical protein